MDINGKNIVRPYFLPYTPRRLYDVNNTTPYDPTPRSGEIQHTRDGDLAHLSHITTPVKSVFAYPTEGDGDGLDIEKNDCPGFNMKQCEKRPVRSSDEKLAIIAQEFSAEARKLANQRNELKQVADEFATEAEKLAAKRLVVKLKAAMNSFGMSVTRKSEEELGIIAEEFSAEAEKLATQRLAMRLNATMNNLGLSLMKTSEDCLGIIADDFRSEAELRFNRRLDANKIFTRAYTNEVASGKVLKDGVKYEKDLAIIAEEFATEARTLTANRQAIYKSNTMTNNNLKTVTQTRAHALPDNSSEPISSPKVQSQRKTVVKKSENHLFKNNKSKNPSRVSPGAGDITGHEQMSKANLQQISLMFRVETPRQANIKITESNSREIVTRKKVSRVSPKANEISKRETITSENVQQIALLFRVETPTVVTKRTSNMNKERKHTSRMSSVLKWLRNLRGVVFGSG